MSLTEGYERKCDLKHNPFVTWAHGEILPPFRRTYTGAELLQHLAEVQGPTLSSFTGPNFTTKWERELIHRNNVKEDQTSPNNTKWIMNGSQASPDNNKMFAA